MDEGRPLALDRNAQVPLFAGQNYDIVSCVGQKLSRLAWSGQAVILAFGAARPAGRDARVNEQPRPEIERLKVYDRKITIMTETRSPSAFEK